MTNMLLRGYAPSRAAASASDALEGCSNACIGLPTECILAKLLVSFDKIGIYLGEN